MLRNPNTLINSPFTTSNMYVKRGIIQNNIARILEWQQSTPNQNVRAKLWFDVKAVLSKQQSLLKETDLQIMQFEQTCFNFGL